MSERLFQALQRRPEARVLVVAPEQAQADAGLTGAALMAAVEALADWLSRHNTRVLAVLADNGPAWAIADLAALWGGLVHLPLPGFFSPEQLTHALETTGTDSLLTDTPARIEGLGLDFTAAGTWHGLTLMRRQVAAVSLPSGTAKISFTSGSTGRPKGVCLSAAGLMDTAEAVAAALAHLPLERHLAVLPLALLLENVAGVYAPLLRGTEVALPSLAQVGWQGMSGFDPHALAIRVDEYQASSAILVPELLKAWTQYLSATRQRAPAHLRFVAVGGARSDAGLLAWARDAGLPAYEGYGLTECGSVVSLNRPGQDLPASVGQALAHVAIDVARDGEIRIRSRAFLGYLRDAALAGPGSGQVWPTGDLGHLDDEGFLHLNGRRKNLLITAYGRNVAPEWVEAALTAQPEIAQAMVVGDGRPWLAGVLVPAPGVDSNQLSRAVARANHTLPDYARLGDWISATPFTPHNAMLTGNGRPRRDAIATHYAAALAALYQRTETTHAFL